ncbi:AcrB/AcrD/AcrF family protein [Sphingosinicella sp. LHD-64]|uniref:AcrB/AcrD/AcrF family protein n=1 Tax=Sphingosinicella sp. LHD-64 TaxID=3072139 RepID=UPI00280D13A3|nr:AcrB/AcrD/AcrF family protein [Sphingosinicella sp. LHD-64]MDQ8755827.1 AcrB/AcrD/AcrF family protein [Sphingosinicella sp. LHD-64]
MKALDQIERHWRWWLLAFWLIVAGYSIYARWAAIQGFGLGDTDDNLRMMQVRAWLGGQAWYDLRQYRLNPPMGADVHWSRLVDLPIAGLKLLLMPILGGARAEQVAVAVAPLLPMLVAMAALAVAVRRLLDNRAFLIAILLLACAGSARGMWAPLRIDHHGWQLAMLALAVMALTDPKRGRGGVILGLATAASLTIGLEMLLYLALAGIVTVLRWVWDGEEARRLGAYGVSLAGGCAFGFLAFASYANRAPVCDALSPVWLSAMTAAGAIAVGLAWANPHARHWRLAAAAAGGLVIAGAFALTWPGCLGRLEQAPPELDRLWLSRVREAMPIYRHGFQTAAATLTLPIAGLIGYALMLWTHRRDPARWLPWAAVAIPAILALALLFWQTRAGPAAQLLSVPGATALVWAAILWLASLRQIVLRVAGILVVFLIVSGTVTGYLNSLFPSSVSAYRKSVNIANATCPTLRALRPVAQQPKGTVLTFVDLGPRLITVTHHDAIAGPYHRNAQQILDVMHAWRGTAENARQAIRQYRVAYVLICPNMSESTIYRSEAPEGLYAQLARGRVPGWLQPVQLPSGSPYKMWRVIS